jgi:DNA polymerase-3 subunit delta
MARPAQARDPRATLRSVEAEARRGWPAGLTVLHGDDRYHLERAQRAILGSLEEGLDPAFGRTVFGDERIDVAAVVAAARSVGMFAPRRIVLVRDVATLSADDDTLPALVDFAAAPPRASYLIVRARALDLRRKLHKTLADSGRRLDFPLPEDERRNALARDVLADLARERGLQVAREAAELLVEVTAADLERIERELDKIAAWVDAGDSRVPPEVVLEVAAGSGLVSGWAAAEAWTRRDRPAALEALRRSVDAGDPPLKILGGLAWRVRVLLQAKALAGAGVPMGRILQMTRAWRFERDLATGIAGYGIDELRDAAGTLLAADRALKSTALPPRAILEALADKLMEPRR